MAVGDKIAVLALTQEGLRLAERLAATDTDFAVYALAETESGDNKRFSRVSTLVEELFTHVNGFVFIMASGIAVRTLGPLLTDKRTDPGAVVVDEMGDHVISLVGGHEGGANNLAYRVSSILGGRPVITTGSEVKKPLTIGVGCRRGASAENIISAIDTALAGVSAKIEEVGCLATIEAKKDESGLAQAAGSLGLPILFISSDQINRGPRATTASAAARRAFGVDGVCEPAAVLAGPDHELLAPKCIYGDVTVAIACRRGALEVRLKSSPPKAPSNTLRGRTSGTLTLVGIGQGKENITYEAVRAIRQATDVIGYKTYIDGIKHLLGDGQAVHPFSMRQEVARAGLAVALAREGRRVAVVSSGDVGIYGMAGPVLELLEQGDRDIDVRIVPGVTAAIAAAAALGAPLMNDFATISLSDLLTPWSEIERRLDAVAAADLVIAIYNPRSRKRQTQLHSAVEIILKHRPPSTPVGIVRELGRTAEMIVTDLENLGRAAVDMRSTLIIGNSKTANVNGRLVTARGYRL